MKKSIAWLQRKYVGSYLLYLETQGETFHATFHGFQWKYITSFVASTFAVHFLQKVFMKALNVLFSICQKKISTYPSHSLSMYDLFNGENSKLSNLTMIMSTQTGFLWCIEVSVPKNIMAFILETVIWDYSWGKVKL